MPPQLNLVVPQRTGTPASARLVRFVLRITYMMVCLPSRKAGVGREPVQAINLYGDRPYLQAGLPEARDFAQATEHSKQLTNVFRSDIQKYWDQLEAARKKLQVRCAQDARSGGEACDFLLPNQWLGAELPQPCIASWDACWALRHVPRCMRRHWLALLSWVTGQNKCHCRTGLPSLCLQLSSCSKLQ